MTSVDGLTNGQELTYVGKTFSGPRGQMSNAVKQQWLEALRSGDYVQTFSFMKRTSRHGAPDGTCQHCVMGVLAEVLGLEFIPGDTVVKEGVTLNRPGIYYDHNTNDKYVSTHRPYGIAGLDDDIVKQVVYLNDRCYKDFNQIAEWIEAKIEGV